MLSSLETDCDERYSRTYSPVEFSAPGRKKPLSFAEIQSRIQYSSMIERNGNDSVSEGKNIGKYSFLSHYKQNKY